VEAESEQGIRPAELKHGGVGSERSANTPAPFNLELSFSERGPFLACYAYLNMPKNLPQVAITKEITRTWADFRRKMRRLRSDIPDCVEAWDCPVYLWLTDPKPQRAFYFTKLTPFRRYVDELRRRVPAIGAMAHSGLPGHRSLASIARIARSLECPLFFVGDLDPGDLTIYATLRCGSPELIQSGKRGLPIQYLGIGGTPFKRLRDKVPDNYWIPMDEAERSHFELIQRLYPHLEEIVGLKELAELRRGRKLEVEAIAAQQQGVTKFTRFLDAI